MDSIRAQLIHDVPLGEGRGDALHDDGIVPPLENGDRLTREEFERRYDAMPTLKKAELLDGVVYMPSPVRQRHHGRQHSYLDAWLTTYEVYTQGVEVGNNATTRLDSGSEPQPDVALFTAPEHGGAVRISEDGYIEGSPDLAAEAAASSASYDVHTKLPIYERNGVRECLIWRVLDRQLDWFVLRDGGYQRLEADAVGVVRSEVFPGLWLDVPALLGGDMATVLAVLQQGLSSPEHAAFVAELASRHQ